MSFDIKAFIPKDPNISDEEAQYFFDNIDEGDREMLLKKYVKPDSFAKAAEDMFYPKFGSEMKEEGEDLWAMDPSLTSDGYSYCELYFQWSESLEKSIQEIIEILLENNYIIYDPQYTGITRPSIINTNLNILSKYVTAANLKRIFKYIVLAIIAIGTLYLIQRVQQYENQRERGLIQERIIQEMIQREKDKTNMYN